MNKDKKTDEEEILLPPYTRLLRVYTYQPYTVHRVKRMLKEIGCVAENINQGYKANRRVGYRELYRIKRIWKSNTPMYRHGIFKKLLCRA